MLNSHKRNCSDVTIIIITIIIIVIIILIIITVVIRRIYLILWFYSDNILVLIILIPLSSKESLKPILNKTLTFFSLELSEWQNLIVL